MRKQHGLAPFPPSWQLYACSVPFARPMTDTLSFAPLSSPFAIILARTLFIFSAIFSHTRGTPRKMVGLTAWKRSLMEATFRS